MRKLRSMGNYTGWCMAIVCWLLLPTLAQAIEPTTPQVLPAPMVTAQREGRLLVLRCELRNADGSQYRENREYPPQFVVYQGDELIGSGSFEYG